MDSGIYIIRNTRNGKVYIGQSRRISNREYCHFHSLEKGKHHNKHLQRAYNTYGADAFTFEILEYCDIEHLDEREKYWIKQYDAVDKDHGYNNEYGGNVGKEVSESVREAKRGANNPNYGKKTSAETKAKMRQSTIGTNTNLTAEQVYQMKDELLGGMTEREASQKYGITIAAVGKIRTCKNWDWVHSDINEDLIFQKEDERLFTHQVIKMLDRQGLSRQEIAKQAMCNASTVARVLGKRSEYYRDSDKNKALQKKVVADFLAGIDRKEIQKKYGITDTKYVSLISEAYNKRREEHIAKAIELRKSGMMVKDIAKKLGYARTTISRWTISVK